MKKILLLCLLLIVKSFGSLSKEKNSGEKDSGEKSRLKRSKNKMRIGEKNVNESLNGILPAVQYNKAAVGKLVKEAKRTTEKGVNDSVATVHKAVKHTKKEAGYAAKQIKKAISLANKESKDIAAKIVDKVTGDYHGKTVYTGPGGGKYYMNSHGGKTYLH